MQYRSFPKDGQKVSALGMGCMRFPLKDGAVDRAAAISLLRRAIDGGVTYVDTAYAYHDGESERIVGEALEGGYRERVLLATKLPMWLLKTPEDMERIFNEQLQKLRTDHVDVYLLHALDKERFEKALKLGALDFMRRLRAEGRARRVGFSFHDEADVFRRILDSCDWDVCQVQMNLLDERHQATMDGVRLAGKARRWRHHHGASARRRADKNSAGGGGRALQRLRTRAQPRGLGFSLSDRPAGGDHGPLGHDLSAAACGEFAHIRRGGRWLPFGGGKRNARARARGL